MTESLTRLEERVQKETMRWVLLAGQAAQRFASLFQPESEHVVDSAPTLGKLRGLAEKRLDNLAAEKTLSALVIADTEDAVVSTLFSFMDWLKLKIRSRVRLVTVGALEIEDFRLLKGLLDAHLVDWLASEVSDEEALRRFRHAWQQRVPLAHALVGSPNASVQHVLAHRQTLQLDAEELGLYNLTSKYEFCALIAGNEPNASWEQSKFMLEDLKMIASHRGEAWQRNLEVSRLFQTDSVEKIDKESLLRAWCIWLAIFVEDFAASNATDADELLRVRQIMGVAQSTFLGDES